MLEGSYIYGENQILNTIFCFYASVLTSLTAWMLEGSYIYGENQTLNTIFCFYASSIHFLSLPFFPP
jgi:hypothetical protein